MSTLKWQNASIWAHTMQTKKQTDKNRSVSVQARLQEIFEPRNTIYSLQHIRWTLGSCVRPGEGWARQVVPCLWVTMKWQPKTRPYRAGRRPGQQGQRLPPYTRTEVLSMLLVHHPRFLEETTSSLEHEDTKCCRETPGTNTRNWQVQTEHLWNLWDEMEEL